VLLLCAFFHVPPRFVNIDPQKAGDPHWMAYTATDSAKIEKNKARASLNLNDTYKIDYRQLRQIRRDDDSRWRAIKRGGSATDPPPKVDGDDGDEGEDDGVDEGDDGEADGRDEKPKAKTKAKAAPKAAAKAKPKAKAKGKAAAAAAADEEEEEEEAVAAAEEEEAKAAPAKPAAKGKAKPAAAAAAAAPAASASASMETDPAWTVPATPSPFSKEAVAAAAAEQAAAKPAAAAAASKPAPAAAASAGNSATEAKLRSELDSLRQQLADVEAEQEESSAASKKTLADAAAAHKAELAAATAAHKQALADAKAQQDRAANAAQAALTAAKNEVAAIKGELAAAKNDATAAKNEANAAKAEAAAAKAAAAKAAAAAREAADARAEAARLRALYTTLVGAIKPVAEAFGLSKASPIGRILAEWEATGGGSAPTSASASAAAASAAKKRGRDEEEGNATGDDEDEPPAAKKARAPSPPAVAARPAAKPAAAAAAAALPAPSYIDDDATQPMQAPEDEPMAPAAAAAASVPASAKPAATAAPFLPVPVRLEGQLVSRPSDSAALSMASVRAQGPGGAKSIALVGALNGAISLWSFNSAATGPTAAARLELTQDKARDVHPHATLAVAGDDGDWSKTRYVSALLVLPLLSDAGGNTFVVLAGEGRLLRSYALTLDAAGSQGSMKLLPGGVIDMGDGSWVTCLTRLVDPAAAAGSKMAYVGVGVSGAGHAVKVVRVALGGAVAAAKPVQVRSLPTRSEEVRGVAQLRSSSGRIVVAGCSVALPGSLDEGGAIELFDFEGAADGAQGELLKHDLTVHPSIGLRCNGIRVVAPSSAGGGESLLCAFEFCANGARQLTLYTFDRAGMRDVSVTNLEAKHAPPADENTFTSIAVAPLESGPSTTRALAMTYGGKLLCFDLTGETAGPRKLLASAHAHGEAPQEDSTHVFVLEPPGAARPIILTTGGKSELKLWK
jgi:hypothetical protein